MIQYEYIDRPFLTCVSYSIGSLFFFDLDSSFPLSSLKKRVISVLHGGYISGILQERQKEKDRHVYI
ncbi:hypothetical protein Pdw03_0521 [Penicillium digitatum]|uniref:Uncharacterized protein n=1 Tax=Penicillium digitatum TaxID=36651 RepID=A0A7T6XQN4_PENDI|nr:hypothetical protein Pdw03_0521 [Penicillium digitatum]